MASLNELESKVPSQNKAPLSQSRNNAPMSVTRLVSQLGMLSHPAAPHRAELGSAQFGSVEQQFDPEVTFAKQFVTAVLSAPPSANGAASAPGMRVQHTTHIATNARDREIRIPPGSIVPRALAPVRPTVDARTSGPALKSRESAHCAAGTNTFLFREK